MSAAPDIRTFLAGPQRAAPRSSEPAGASAQGGPAFPTLVRPETRPERRRRAPVKIRGLARAALAGTAELLVPTKDPLPFDAAAHCVPFVERYLAHLPRLLRMLFPVGLTLFELSPLLLGMGKRFSRLSRARREAFVHRVEGTALLAPLADVWQAVRGLSAAAYYSHPSFAARIGFEQQAWIDAKVRERRERFGAPEPW